MAIKFTDLKGKASKAGPPRMKFLEGVNKFRIVSPVVPGYKYWLKDKNDQAVPMDCLSFNRNTEEFDSKTKDWVRHYFPDKKCSWAYCSFVIDRTDNKLKLLDHKKKLLDQILDAAKKKLGDPSDIEKGWDVICTRTKTGNKVYNVEYTLDVFDLVNSPLSDQDRETIKEMPDIEDFLKVSTPEEQKEFIEKRILGGGDTEETDIPEDLDDDIPFN